MKGDALSNEEKKWHISHFAQVEGSVCTRTWSRPAPWAGDARECFVAFKQNRRLLVAPFANLIQKADIEQKIDDLFTASEGVVGKGHFKHG